MNHFLCSSLLLLAPLSAGPAPALRPQEETPPEDKRAVVAELIQRLHDHAGARGKEDQEAVGVIGELVVEFPRSGPRDRKAIVKALDKCFEEKRGEQDGELQNQLYLGAAEALGGMAPESVDVLIGWIGHKAHRDDVTLQRRLIRMLGKTKSEDGRRPLIKLLTHRDALIQSAAAEALGDYEDAEQDARKECFEELLKELMTVKGQKDSDPNDTIARDRWDVIAAPIVSSLGRLSRHQELTPEDWQRWYNKNRREDWDEPR